MKFLILALPWLLGSAAQAAPPDSFETTVRPFVAIHCYGCHNEKVQSGGLNLKAFPDARAFGNKRDIWERVLGKLRAGEMPPEGVAKPPAGEITAVTAWLETEFSRQDAAAPPDPGITAARRLNRYEYNNTIRDLLAIDFRPADDFPADDFGYGFDNIGAVLTTTPVLLEKYLAAARKIARLATETPPIPKKPVVERYKNLSVLRSFIWNRRFPWEGDYDIRLAVGGRRDVGDVFLSFDEDPPRKYSLVEATGQEFRHYDFSAHVTAGVHQIRAWVSRDYEATLEQAWKDEQTRVSTGRFSAKGSPNGGPAMTKEEVRKKLLDGTLRNGNGNLEPPYPEYFEVRGPRNAKPARPPDGYKLLFTCGHAPGHHTPQCARTNLASFATRAWRRPVSAPEVDKLLSYVRAAQRDGEPLDTAMEEGVVAVLVSPYFLFRTERDANVTDTAKPHRVSDFELATRLSYFLWSTTPDEELARNAAQGKLSQPDVLSAQVTRMLRDPKAEALADNFGGQWLQFRNLSGHKPDPDRFPEFTGEIREAMKDETRLFFNHILRENRGLPEFLTAKYTFLNEPLANYYGIPDVTGYEFRRVDLTGTPRTGVLTQGSVLTVSSYPTRTSPVVRGKWILENLLNAPPPPPPPNVPVLDESTVGITGTLRQQLEKHRANAICAGCHSRMDPLGFGLENLDAVGRWRSMDGSFPIDSKGTLPSGQSFSGPEELAGILASTPDVFARAMTEKLLTFALGRGLEVYDRPAVDSVCRRSAGNGYLLQDLIMEIVKSAPFLMRRGDVNRGSK